MDRIRKNGATSNVFRITLRNNSTGQGLTGLSSASSGLIISSICDNEAAATVYTVAGSTIETIATLATFAAPTATKIRFKEVDATNHPGLYEIQIADARMAVSGAKFLVIAISGATNLLMKELRIQLDTFDLDSASPDANASKIGGTAQTGLDLGGTWTNARALHLDADVSSRMATYTQPSGFLAATFPSGTVASTTNITAGVITTTTNVTNAPPDSAGVTSLLSRLSLARAGYLDNLNVGGAVASHADITALNQSASRHLILTTVAQYEPGEAYTIECRTYQASDGAAVNADTTPTITVTGKVSGSLAANLGAVSNPATGVYRATYTVPGSPTLEEIRVDVSAAINSSTFTLSAYTQTVAEATVVWTSTDQSHLTSIYNKLPSGTMTTPGDAMTLTVAYDAAKTAAQASALSSFAAQFVFTESGYLDVNTRYWAGAPVGPVNVSGYPLVDIAYWGGVAPLALSSQKVQAVSSAAPTTGDLTAAMKASVTTAATAATPIAASVAGNIGGLAAQAKTDVQAALTSQGLTTTRAAYLDNINVSFGNTINMATRWLGMVELSGSLYRYTVAAVANAPSGSGGGGGDTYEFDGDSYQS